jgi:putative transcriptional regulator
MKNRLTDLRAERAWTQADLAQRVSVSRQTINAIEKGKFDPSLPLAFRLANLFNLKIEDIFIGSSDLSGVDAAEQVPVGSAGVEQDA